MLLFTEPWAPPLQNGTLIPAPSSQLHSPDRHPADSCETAFLGRLWGMCSLECSQRCTRGPGSCSAAGGGDSSGAMEDTGFVSSGGLCDDP